MKTGIIYVLLALLWVGGAAAATKIDGIWYNLDSKSLTAEVTRDTNGSLCHQSSVVIPDSVLSSGRVYAVTAVGDSAFVNCTDINSVSIPLSVAKIGRRAFDACGEIEAVLKSRVPPLCGVNAFDRFSTIVVPCGTVAAYIEAEEWENLNMQIFSECLWR